MTRLALTFLGFAVAGLVGCGGDELDVPEGVTCNATLSAGSNGASLTEALASAKSGDCVVAGQAVYEGNFVVPAGVSLVNEPGTTPDVRGTGVGAAAIEITGDPGSLLQGITVSSSQGDGVLLRGTHGTLRSVTVTGAASAAAVLLAKRGVGTPDTRTVGTPDTRLIDVRLQQSSIGLVVSGVRVALEGGVITGHSGQSLSGGIGVLALDGAVLHVIGTTVDSNSYGVVIDGELTTALLSGIQVRGNTERGIWAQGLVGTVDEPALTVDGADTMIEENHLVGLGAVQCSGIAVLGGTIRGTIAKTVVTDLNETVMVGDGLGLFAGSARVKVEGVTFEGNERSQALIDQGGEGITIKGGSVTAAQGLKVVVQNTTTTVDVPADYLSAPNETLAVSASLVPVAGIVE
jgi:hypothetical protein